MSADLKVSATGGQSAGATAGLKPPQEIEDVLLVLVLEMIVVLDDFVRLAARALVVLDGFHQIGGASVMEKEDALPKPPERSGSKLIRAGAPLGDAVGQAFPHVVDEQVGPEIHLLIGEGLAGDSSRSR